MTLGSIQKVKILSLFGIKDTWYWLYRDAASYSGDAKLFDFGLAKEYDPSKVDKNGCYKMTACTASPRYMAPEVALGKPYNETIDVYSFGLLLYQILALEAPFEGLTIKSLPKIVGQFQIQSDQLRCLHLCTGAGQQRSMTDHPWQRLRRCS